MKDYVEQNIISILALSISMISLGFTIRREFKSIVNITIKSCKDECIYFTRMDKTICFGIIACRVKITNKSNVECGISDVTLKLGNTKYDAKPFDEIVVTNSDDIEFKNLYTHIPKYMRLNSENIFKNLQLKPYETKNVYVTFPASIAIPEEIAFGTGNSKLKFIIANKAFVCRTKIQLISGELKQI